MNQRKPSYILTITCPDTIGIVAEVAGFLRDQQYFIEESSHFGDRGTGQFFMRTRFTYPRWYILCRGFRRRLRRYCRTVFDAVECS